MALPVHPEENITVDKNAQREKELTENLGLDSKRKEHKRDEGLRSVFAWCVKALVIFLFILILGSLSAFHATTYCLPITIG